jgi:hypothetical protein
MKLSPELVESLKDKHGGEFPGFTYEEENPYDVHGYMEID